MIHLKMTVRKTEEGSVATFDHMVKGQSWNHTLWFPYNADNVSIELRNMLGERPSGHNSISGPEWRETSNVDKLWLRGES